MGGVGFVVNVDFPLSVASYTHRIGRTARGGAQGTALSLVSEGKEEEAQMLKAIQLSQSPHSQAGKNTLLTDAAGNNTNDSMLQPSFLSFDLRELEGFRYRIDDMKKCVSKAAVRDARLAEIKQELVNSEALQSHFVTNPNDFQVLRHDKNISKDSFRTRHLKTLPAYLLPQGMKIGKDPNRKRKRKHNNRNSGRGTTGSNNTN